MNNTGESSRIRDIRLFEEALPRSLFERLVRAVRDIGDERIQTNYDTTFWFPRDKEPTNVAEEAIVALVALVNPSAECSGTEWWLGRLGHGEKLPFHFDRDLSLHRSMGEYVPPLCASILYLNTFPSSPTVFLGQVAGPDGKTRIPKKPEFREAVDAVANRYVVFSGRLRHGVVPGKESVDRARHDKNGGTRPESRLSLLVNYWHRRPSAPICTDYDGTIYARLTHDEFGRPVQGRSPMPRKGDS